MIVLLTRDGREHQVEVEPSGAGFKCRSALASRR